MRVNELQNVVVKQRNRILVVDDDGDARELIWAVLTEAGYRVDVAIDGFGAIESVLTSRPDLVLTDLMMPGIHGVDLAQRIRAFRSGLPVILMTGRETFGLCTDAEAYGAVACLVKPINLEELLWTIDRALACGAAGAQVSRV
jgi:DNA-binding response OmpR family regulator